MQQESTRNRTPETGVLGNKKNLPFYIGLIAVGAGIIALNSLIQQVPPEARAEYRYSSFFRDNYTLLPKIILPLVGLAVGYFTRLSPLISGICLYLIFPLTAAMEAVIFKSSHNLIPFEFLMYLGSALPTIALAYTGRLLKKRS